MNLNLSLGSDCTRNNLTDLKGPTGNIDCSIIDDVGLRADVLKPSHGSTQAAVIAN